jgi:tripartite-type tricarboxylate transporter receptor subunit TctC
MSMQVPARNVAELIKLAKSKPGSLSYGAPTGSGPYLAMEMFRTMADIDIRHIPYKSTTTVAVDMLSGVVDLASMTAPSVIGHVRANKLRAIAQTGETRLAIVQDVPTLDEAGLKGFNVTTWYMALGPAKLPASIVAHLNAEFTKALAIPDVRKRSLDNGVDEIIGSSPQDATSFLREESSRWSKVLKPIPE